MFRTLCWLIVDDWPTQGTVRSGVVEAYLDRPHLKVLWNRYEFPFSRGNGSREEVGMGGGMR